MRPQPIQGIYEDQFWSHVQRHALHLQRCDACGRFMYPPAPRCAGCLSEQLTWTPVQGTGRIISWVRFHRTYFSALAAPYLVAAVELPEGPILIAGLRGAEDPQIGEPVHLVYDDEEGGVIYNWARGAGGAPLDG